MNKINATSGAHVPEEVKKAYEEKFQQHADKLISIRVKLEDLQAREAQQQADLKGAKTAVILLRKDVDVWQDVAKVYKPT